MKTIYKVLIVAITVIASTFEISAQGNNMDPNANYKHQIPTSEGTTFKDSFKNDNMIDFTSDNYKQPKNKKAKKTVTKTNANTTSQKASNANSKHPYGL